MRGKELAEKLKVRIGLCRVQEGRQHKKRISREGL